jgi:hypothetical protein
VPPLAALRVCVFGVVRPFRLARDLTPLPVTGLLKPVEVREQCLVQADGVAAPVAHQLLNVLEEVAAPATEVASQIGKRFLCRLQQRT